MRTAIIINARNVITAQTLTVGDLDADALHDYVARQTAFIMARVHARYGNYANMTPADARRIAEALGDAYAGHFRRVLVADAVGVVRTTHI